MRASFGSPVSPRAGKEIDETVAVNAADRCFAEPLRLAHVAEPDLAHAREDHLRAPWHLEARLHLSVDQLGVAVMAAVKVGIDRQHAPSPKDENTTASAEAAAEGHEGHEV
jgi:hypothetical protein